MGISYLGVEVHIDFGVISAHNRRVKPSVIDRSIQILGDAGAGSANLYGRVGLGEAQLPRRMWYIVGLDDGESDNYCTKQQSQRLAGESRQKAKTKEKGEH